MKNKLSDLNNYLFEALERISDDSLTPEELEREITKADTTTKIAEAIIKSGELTLKAIKHANEYGISTRRQGGELTPMPEFLLGE